MNATANGSCLDRIPLDRIPHVWRAESLMRGGAIATGYAALDSALGGGWPVPSLIEVLCDYSGIGELQLLRTLWHPRALPACAEQRHVVLWLNAPWSLHAVALEQLGFDPTRHWVVQGLSEHDVVWAMEQALRSASCTVVVAWSHTVTLAMLRRLKLAACGHDSIGVLFRPGRAMAAPSPATLRLRLQPAAAQLQLEVLKIQGRSPSTVLLSLATRTQRSCSGGRENPGGLSVA